MSIFDDIDNIVQEIENAVTSARYDSMSLAQLKTTAGSVDPRQFTRLADTLDTHSTQVNSGGSQLQSAVVDVTSGWKGSAAGQATSSMLGTAYSTQGTASTATSYSGQVRAFAGQLEQHQKAVADTPEVDTSMSAAIARTGGPVASIFNPMGVAANYGAAQVAADQNKQAAAKQLVAMDKAGQDFASTSNNAFTPTTSVGIGLVGLPKTLAVEPVSAARPTTDVYVAPPPPGSYGSEPGYVSASPPGAVGTTGAGTPMSPPPGGGSTTVPAGAPGTVGGQGNATTPAGSGVPVPGVPGAGGGGGGIGDPVAAAPGPTGLGGGGLGALGAVAGGGALLAAGGLAGGGRGPAFAGGGGWRESAGYGGGSGGAGFAEDGSLPRVGGLGSGGTGSPVGRGMAEFGPEGSGRGIGIVFDLPWRGGPFRAENVGVVARRRRRSLVPRGRGLVGRWELRLWALPCRLEHAR